MEKIKLEISWGSLWRVIAVALIVVAAYYLKDVIVAILLSVFISTALSGVVLKLEKFRLPRIVATIIIFIFVLAFLTFILYTIVPIAIIELNSLINNIDGTVGNVLGPETTAQIKTIISPDLNHLADILLTGTGSFLDVIGRLLGGASYFFTVLVLSFYMTASRDGVSSFLRAIFPRHMEETAIHVYERTRRKVSRWFHAQFILSVLVGVLVFGGLTILGVRYAMILALLAGAFEFIPIVGPIFAGATSIIIATTASLPLGFYTFLLFLVIQQLESNVFVPLMMKKAINIHPVFMLIAILGGFKLAGFPGMLLAIPAAVLVEDAVDDWVHRKSKTADNITIA